MAATLIRYSVIAMRVNWSMPTYQRRIIQTNSKFTMKRLLSSSIVLCVVFVAGCAAVVATDQTKATSPSDGAVIRGQWSGPLSLYKPYVTIRQVDGRQRLQKGMGVSPIIVDPGLRTLTVIGHEYHGTQGIYGQVDLKVELKAGYSYLVRFEYRENVMTFWVEDVATHNHIGSPQSTKEIAQQTGGSLNLPIFPP